MEFKIIKPQSQHLKKSIDYFLFIKSSSKHLIDSYTTIPNTNVCLSLYKNNTIHWNRDKNNCQIFPSETFAESRIYGWHNRQFSVTISGQLDQVCMVFKPLGLANFTKTPLHEIGRAENPFELVFGRDSKEISHRIFTTTCEEKRSATLEYYLLKYLTEREVGIVEVFMDYISVIRSCEKSSIRDFCRTHKINESTLYRHFVSSIGESAKSFERKHRFRTFLSRWNSYESLTRLSYSLNYADQSHLIKEVKKYSGLTPKKLLSRVKTVEQELLLLM